jgi:hypothetical protein
MFMDIRGQAVGLKVAGVAGLVALLGIAMIMPFGAGGDRNVASCPVDDPGRGGEPIPEGTARVRQIAYAKIIDSVAVSRGLPGQATLVALMTALQESQLENIAYGDRDSVGLFQQRPSAGWGTIKQIMDPVYATEAFFGGSKPPSPRGLVDIDRWPSMPYTEAAQAVQVSAFPNAYAKQERRARQIAASAGIDLERAGDPYAGRAGPNPTAPSGGPSDVAATLDPCDDGGGVISGQPVNGVWPEQQPSVADPTGTGGFVTPRTAAWVAQARTALSSPPMSCWDAHAWNPTSDHPRGKACDVFVGGDSRRSAPMRAKGDSIAKWTLQTAAKTGVRYVIWYGKIWSARTGKWKPYNGGGVYDPTDATGGHFDHVHVSLY